MNNHNHPNQWVLERIAALAQLAHHPPLPLAPLDDSDESDEDDSEKRMLFVANLDDRVTEDLLYEVFVQAGPIESVRIPKNPQGKQRGFGFVTYQHECTPPYAMQIYKNLELFRRSLTIKHRGSLNPPMYNPGPLLGNFILQCSKQQHERKAKNYNNSSVMCASNYSACNVSQPEIGPKTNPFQGRSADWTLGNSQRGREYIAPTRHRHESSPYKRQKIRSPEQDIEHEDMGPREAEEERYNKSTRQRRHYHGRPRDQYNGNRR